MKKYAGVAIAALFLSACGTTVEDIRAAGEKARTVVDEVRKTRCDTIPSADIKELRECEEAAE
jgi:PBP1b-binding outer membrane lipoprotein LpoB